MIIIRYIFSLFIVLISTTITFGQNFGNEYYRLTTQSQGAGRSLDVINDGRNNKVHLAHTGHFTGQMWKITDLGNGYYRLTTQWQGVDKSLDAINDGKNNQIRLAKSGNLLGQMWKIEKYTP